MIRLQMTKFKKINLAENLPGTFVWPPLKNTFSKFIVGDPTFWPKHAFLTRVDSRLTAWIARALIASVTNIDNQVS